MQRPRRAQHVHAVAAAHLEVAQHDVEVAVVQPLDGGVAVRGLVDFVAGLGQPAHQPAPERIVIVGDENSTHVSVAYVVRSGSLLEPARRARTGSVTRNRVPGPGALLDVDAPVVRVDDLPDDCQARGRIPAAWS